MKMTLLFLPVILLFGLSTASGASLGQLEQCWNKSYEYLGQVTNDNAFNDPYYQKKMQNDGNCYAIKGTLEKESGQKIECFYIKAASGYKCGKNAKEFQTAQMNKPKLGKDKDGFYLDWVSEKSKYSPNNFKDEIQKVLPSKQSTLSFPKFSGHFLMSGVTLRKEHCYGEEIVQSRV